MSVLCVECHDTKMPDTGMFYNGTKEGYSNYDWQCCLCQKYIHKSDDCEQYEEDAATS